MHSSLVAKLPLTQKPPVWVEGNPFSLMHALRMTCLVLRATACASQHRGLLRRQALAHRTLKAFSTPLLDPVFLIGAPRSGTTFLGNCIGSLSSVVYYHEPENTKCAVAEVFRGASPRLMANYYRFQYKLLIAFATPDGKSLFIEKTPRNCFIVPFLARVFPRARFVNIVRDGRDAAYSNAQKPWLQAAFTGAVDTAGYPMGAVPQFWLNPSQIEEFVACSDLQRCAWAWKSYAAAARTALATLPTARVLELKYEQLVSHPHIAGRRLAEFLDLHAADSSRLTSALSEANPGSVGTAERNLSRSEFRQLGDQCQPLLGDLGYQS